METIKYCKCGCVVSGNYHVNTDSSYRDKSVKGYNQTSELGNIWVIKCKAHKCTNPAPKGCKKWKTKMTNGCQQTS